MPFKKKEEKREYDKKYREANKEKIAARGKLWREANKEYSKAWNESKKDGLYTVYYLKEEHYAGMTSNLTYRLYEHKSEHSRHIEYVEVIGKYKTKAEAIRVEAALHAMGYNGRHPNYKQQTLKQLL
jgi:hypothetical protein